MIIVEKPLSAVRGSHHATGDGVTKSLSEARRWYTEVVEKAAGAPR